MSDEKAESDRKKSEWKEEDEEQLSEELGRCNEKKRRIEATESSAESPPLQISNSSHRAGMQTTDSVAASPPRFISFDDIMKMTKGVTDLTLAHEIAVNDDFRLETSAPASDSLEGQIQHIVNKAFWDMLEEKLKTEPDDYSHSIKLLEDVKTSLLELLLPQHVRLRAQIESVLDLSLIEQKAEHGGGVDFHYYADYVIGVMSMLCAPVRDEQISALRQETDVLKLYKQICELLSQMKLDMVNFTISQLRPMLKQHSAQYERNKFNSLLETQKENGVDGLEFTRDWLSKQYSKCKNSVGGVSLSKPVNRTKDESVSITSQGQLASSQKTETDQYLLTSKTTPEETTSSDLETPSNSADNVRSDAAANSNVVRSLFGPASSSCDTVRSRAVINAAYVELLDWDFNRVYPETMLVDMKRLVELQERVLTLTLVASVLAVTYSTVGSLLRDLEEFKVKLKKHVMIIISGRSSAQTTEPVNPVNESQHRHQDRLLDEVMKNVSEEACQLTCQSLEQRGYKTPTTDQLRLLKGQVHTLAQLGNPIRQVMRTRVCGFILNVISAPSGTRAVQSDIQIPAGFTALEEELRRVSESFIRLISYNYAVYSSHYHNIIDNLATEQNSSADDATAMSH